MTPRQPPTAELLEEHSAFLRNLARGLVQDEQRAEDVVQETYLAALAKPPSQNAGLRAWLAAVTRNLALRTRRQEGRLTRRERAAAYPEGLPSIADVSARLEIQRRIADAVGELKEPGRSAVVLRYFDGLKPSVIAKREGVPVRTIETRLRRAREKLRYELDKAHGGVRAVWHALLIPIISPGLVLGTATAAGTGAGSATSTVTASGATATASKAATVTGVILMSTKAIATVAVAVCLGGGFAAGWLIKPEPKDEPVPTTQTNDLTDTSPEEATLGTDAMIVANARRDLEAEHLAHRATAEKLEKAEQALAKIHADAHAKAEHGAEADETGPRFTHKSVAEAIQGVNWREAGEALTKIGPLMVDLADSLSTGGSGGS